MIMPLILIVIRRFVLGRRFSIEGSSVVGNLGLLAVSRGVVHFHRGISRSRLRNNCCRCRISGTGIFIAIVASRRLALRRERVEASQSGSKNGLTDDTLTDQRRDLLRFHLAQSSWRTVRKGRLEVARSQSRAGALLALTEAALIARRVYDDKNSSKESSKDNRGVEGIARDNKTEECRSNYGVERVVEGEVKGVEDQLQTEREGCGRNAWRHVGSRSRSCRFKFPVLHASLLPGQAIFILSFFIALSTTWVQVMIHMWYGHPILHLDGEIIPVYSPRPT